MALIQTTSTSLKSELTAFKQSWNARAKEGLQQKFENGIEEIKHINNDALKVGDKAPDFELSNAVNQRIKLSTLIKDGPVVLTWYRGGWCPYCNIQLQSMQRFLPQFKELGARLVALSPELPDKSLSTIEKNALVFEVLTDYNNEVARSFHITFTLNDELVEIYDNFHKLESYNGITTNELPVPATYVIGTNGIIRYAFVDTDYRKRAEPEDILTALKNIYFNPDF